MSQGRYPNVVDAVRRTPWAIHPAMLALILDLVSYRASGQRLSIEEIDERIETRAATKCSYVSGTIEVIPLQGVLMPKANLFTQMSGGTSLQDVCAALKEAVANEQVAQILLDVNSPGGATDMVPETAAAIRDANTQKPVTAIANTDAASAAYWLAAQAGELVCTASGMCGSIGVYAAHSDLSAQMEMLGINTTLISAGPYKTELSPFAPLTPEAQAAVQNVVDQYYAMFVNDVAKGRGVSSADVRAGFGQGRMLTAADALKAGMVDRVATFDQTFSRLAGGKRRRLPALPGMGAHELEHELIEQPQLPAGQPAAGAAAAALEAVSDKPEESINDRAELEAWDLSLALSEQVSRKEQ